MLNTLIQTFTVPEWSLGYLVNDNLENLSPEDKGKVRAFSARELILNVGETSEPFFSHTNDIDNVGGTCVVITCTVLDHNEADHEDKEREADELWAAQPSAYDL